MASRQLTPQYSRCVLLLGLAACANCDRASDVTALKPPPRHLTFSDISSWAYVNGLECMPASVKALSGQRVQMTGALIPINQVMDHELLPLDRDGHLDVHKTVRVVFPMPVQGGRRTDVVRVVGTFSVEPLVVQGYCVGVFRIEVESFERTTWQ
jgi:hypothetical protein